MRFDFPISWLGYREAGVDPADAGRIEVYLHDEDMDHYPEDTPIGTVVASTSLSEMIDDWIDECGGYHSVDEEAIVGLQAIRREFSEQIAKIDAALSEQPGAQKKDIPANLLERLRHHAADKSNTAFARSTMNELVGYLDPKQRTDAPTVDPVKINIGAPNPQRIEDAPWRADDPDLMLAVGRQFLLHPQTKPLVGREALVLRCVRAALDAQEGEAC